MSDYPGKLTREELEALEVEEPGAVSRLREAVMGDEPLTADKVAEVFNGVVLPEGTFFGEDGQRYTVRRVFGEVRLPLEAFENYDPEVVEEFRRQFAEARANGTLKVPTLADLGAEVNPSGAIDLDSSWRPSGRAKLAREVRVAEPDLGSKPHGDLC